MTNPSVHSTVQPKCEVCQSTDLVAALDLGDHPLCDDLVEIGSKRTCQEFRIEISLCRCCGTALQRHQISKLQLFPQTYHYRARFTADVLRGMQSLVDSVHSKYGSVKDKLVIDVGCNDGSLLRMFATNGARVLGIEPTGAAHDAEAAGISVINSYFTPAVAEAVVAKVGHPDFITFTNVFAHIENMPELLKAVQILMADNTRLIVENHYLGSVLQRYQFDTFYHEHPRTYSVRSFVFIAKCLGRVLESVEFPSRYGGNVRVVIGPGANGVGDAEVESALAREQSFERDFGTMRQVIEQWVAGREKLLASVRNEDNLVYAKAFPGRAAIMLKLLKLTDREIAVVFEKPGSLKIGHYVPGTRIPIVSDAEIAERIRQPFCMLNLAWHISDEISSYLKQIDGRIRTVDIFQPSAF